MASPDPGMGAPDAVRSRPRRLVIPHRWRLRNNPARLLCGLVLIDADGPDPYDPDARCRSPSWLGHSGFAPTTWPSTPGSCSLLPRGAPIMPRRSTCGSTRSSSSSSSTVAGGSRTPSCRASTPRRDGTWRAARLVRDPRTASEESAADALANLASTIQTRQRCWWPRSRGATAASRRRYRKSTDPPAGHSGWSTVVLAIPASRMPESLTASATWHRRAARRARLRHGVEPSTRAHRARP